MKFLYCFPGMSVPMEPRLTTADALIELAVAAEDAGFAGVGLDDHPAPPEQWRQDAHGHDGLDPIVGLAAVAGATTTIRLVTYAVVLPYRNPLITAKAVASLDHLSGGRVIAGVATGYLEDEAHAVGADFARRNERFDEAIEVCRLAWSGAPFDFDGAGFRAHQVSVQPPTVQRPHPPMWVGGNSDVALRRVAASCEGWMPLGHRPDMSISRRTPPMDSADLGRKIDRLKSYLAEAGRDEFVDVLYGAKSLNEGSPGSTLGELRRLADIGVTWVAVRPRATTMLEAKDHVARFREEVLGPLQAETTA